MGDHGMYPTIVSTGAFACFSCACLLSLLYCVANMRSIVESVIVIIIAIALKK